MKTPPTTRQLLWGMVALSWLLVVGAIVRHGWTVSGGWSTAATTMGFGGVCLLRRADSSILMRRLLDTIENHVLLSLIAMLGAVSSYLIAAHSTGYHDTSLAGWDSVIGLSWKSWYEVVNNTPAIQFYSPAIYLGVFFLYPSIVISALCFTDRSSRANIFVLTYFIALTITLIIFYYVPAGSPMTFYLGTDQVDGYVPVAPFIHTEIIDSLRSGTMTHIDLQGLHGLIVYPSFHTVAALLFIWASWPIAWLRPTALGLNGAMLLTVPIEGTHYFIDVAGGAMVAAGAILIVRSAQALAAGKGLAQPAYAPVTTAGSAPHP